MAEAHISQEQADEFAIGALEPESERLIALHATECQLCRDVIAEAQRVAAAFALGRTTARPAPARLRNRTFAEAGIERPGPVAIVTRWARAVAGVAAVLVAAAAFTAMVIIRDQVDELRDDNAVLQEQVNRALSQEVEIAALGQRLKDEEQVSNELLQAAEGDRQLVVALLSPDSVIADVTTQDKVEGALGRLVWDESDNRMWFVATRLPKLPAGETYQIWVNSEGKWVSLGTFNSDEQGFVRFDTWVPQGLVGYESAAVTIERAGGAPARSGESVFYTDLSVLRR